jgi:hypothetical protein
MSSIIDVTPTVPVVEKVKPERKPTLPAKYTKFMQFGFWFAGQIKDKVLDDASYTGFVEALALFDDLSVQTDLYQSFLDKDNMKENNKTLRKTIAAHKKELAKANAPPKKPRASKKKADPTNDNTDKVKKPRAPKKKSADLVDELVTLASGEPAVPPDAPSLPLATLDDKAAKKAADKAEKDAKKAAEKADKDAKKAADKADKADKPKKATKKETKKPAATVVAEKPSDDDNDEA